jgi:hypothetical protein
MIAITDRTIMIVAKVAAPSGVIGMANRMKPYAPILRSTPARMIDPAVGAST